MSPIALALVLALTPPGDDAPRTARCDRGFPADCRAAGRARLLGDGGARDDRLGAAYVTRACELGDPAACADLGVLNAVGRGLPQSDERSVALSRRACEQGAALGCSNLGALLAEGAGAGARPGDDAASAVALFHKACDAGVVEGCANLGTVLDVGGLTLRDPAAAAAAFRRACDGGLAIACHRLAALLRASPAAAPGLDAGAVAARACRGGVAAACGGAGGAPAPEATRPAARLVEEPRALVLGIPGGGGFTPGELAARPPPARRRVLGELRRTPAAFLAVVPEALRARLGLDGPPSPAPPPADAAIASLLAFRRGALLQCHEGARAVPGVRAEVHAVLFVDGQGRAAEVRAASAPADAPLEACVREVIEGWEFPSSDEGYTGPFLVRQTFEAAPEPAPGFAEPGGLRPALRDPACVERALRVPAELRGGVGAVAVRLAVDASGRPALVHALSPVPDVLADALADAVRACRWSAGGDGEGRPASLWTTLTVRVAGK
jgi:hypothetical protein